MCIRDSDDEDAIYDPLKRAVLREHDHWRAEKKIRLLLLGAAFGTIVAFMGKYNRQKSKKNRSQLNRHRPRSEEYFDGIRKNRQEQRLAEQDRLEMERKRDEMRETKAWEKQTWEELKRGPRSERKKLEEHVVDLKHSTSELVGTREKDDDDELVVSSRDADAGAEIKMRAQELRDQRRVGLVSLKSTETHRGLPGNFAPPHLASRRDRKWDTRKHQAQEWETFTEAEATARLYLSYEDGVRLEAQRQLQLRDQRQRRDGDQDDLPDGDQRHLPHRDRDVLPEGDQRHPRDDEQMKPPEEAMATASDAIDMTIESYTEGVNERDPPTPRPASLAWETITEAEATARRNVPRVKAQRPRLNLKWATVTEAEAIARRKQKPHGEERGHLH
eukprot:2551031-Prymnesium_polylepis.1